MTDPIVVNGAASLPGLESKGEIFVDFTGEDPGKPMLAVPETEPYDPAPTRESARTWIAASLVALYALVCVVLLIFVCYHGTVDDALKTLQLLSSPLVALLGTALGFYFGGKQN